MISNIENIELANSTSIIRDSLLVRIVRRELKKLIIFNLIIVIVSSIIIFLRIYTNLILKHKKEENDKLSYFIFEIIIILISIINGLFGIILVIFEKRKYKIINVIHLILNIISSIFNSLFFIIEFIRWCNNLFDEDQILNNIRLIILLFILIILLCQIGCIIANRILSWTPKYRYSRFILCFSSIILMSISIVSIIYDKKMNHLKENHNIPIWCYTILEISSIYTFICGFIGLCLTFICKKSLNQFGKYFEYIFNIFLIIGLILIILFTIIYLFYYIKYLNKNKLFYLNTLKRSSIILSIIESILLIFIIKSLHNLNIYFIKSNKNGLIIDQIKLTDISSIYIKYWSNAIDKFNLIEEGMTGDAALQLMKAYENCQIENIQCIVLRISRINQSIQIENNQWDNTEAIVLLTIIHNYDIIKASHFDGFWGQILRKTLGSENCIKSFRPLLLRVGLIGYQWPFRTSIFFTKPHYNSLKDNVDLLQTIIHWNEIQKSNIHCDLLLLPTLNTEFLSKAIPISGFFPLVLPPTHLLDLRPHHGKTWNEYIKTLKKGNRRPYIQQFLNKGGTIEEIHNLNSHEIGEIICKQFNNIAQIRNKNKEAPTLFKPSIEFISSMGHFMNESYRSVVFLRFNNEVIASSVIYKFPYKLLTTDIQGLTHEKARPLKAYFVMLQWIIKQALEQKYHFIDFGPTTSSPKLDLGCKSVPLEVGGYTSNPILAFAIQQAGNMVNTVHNKKHYISNQNQNKQQQQQSHPDTQIFIDNHLLSQNSSTEQKTTNIDISQTQHQEVFTVTTDNEIQSKDLSKKKTNDKE